MKHCSHFSDVNKDTRNQPFVLYYFAWSFDFYKLHLKGLERLFSSKILCWRFYVQLSLDDWPCNLDGVCCFIFRLHVDAQYLIQNIYRLQYHIANYEQCYNYWANWIEKNLMTQKKLDNMDYNLGENMKSFKHQLASHTKDKNCSHAKGLSKNNTYLKSAV